MYRFARANNAVRTVAVEPVEGALPVSRASTTVPVSTREAASRPVLVKNVARMAVAGRAEYVHQASIATLKVYA